MAAKNQFLCDNNNNNNNNNNNKNNNLKVYCEGAIFGETLEKYQ